MLRFQAPADSPDVVHSDRSERQCIGVSIDRQELQEVVGTVAGDDTVLVITADSQAAEGFQKRMLAMIYGEI